jgi:serine/threonine-protein kinase RsbW
MLMRIELTLPRDARYVGVLREMSGCVLDELAVAEDEVDDIQLALSEACANAVRHAVGTKAYRVRLDVDEERCEIEVADIGPGMPRGLPESAEEFEAESGRGLLLMRSLVDDFELGGDSVGTTILLRKRWRQAVAQSPAEPASRSRPAPPGAPPAHGRARPAQGQAQG